ncbi:heme-binding protein [Nocardia sp. CDC186]|uniref:Heme-binding protein n=1 Tax=Nocardia implantans TaxID=3108168 RepID=A0ABU6AU26_9NOCA|nr:MULTISPECIES: heme-binding protein [unclassified Nocardia]MBF6191311.1 heme-binding protein [Nocardia beijingensis]MEA3532956.1 heme-binding protein [Nocardia sp. CDC192]MEB3510978.1 heme-binding protein [Nocardia sp. CDC186]
MTVTTTSITLERATLIVSEALAHGTAHGFDPLTAAVLGQGGHLVALQRQDGSGILRPQIAIAKAWGVLGLPNREIARRAAAVPAFFTSVAALAEGRILDVPGGVFTRDSAGRILGAVGSTGAATSLEDERAAMAGIEAAGPSSDTGEA